MTKRDVSHGRWHACKRDMSGGERWRSTLEVTVVVCRCTAQILSNVSVTSSIVASRLPHE